MTGFWREARVLGPPLFALLTFSALTNLWPLMVAGQGGRTAYWLGRAVPGIMLAGPPLLTLLLTLALPLHLRRAVAMTGLVVFGALAGGFGLVEHARLEPYVISGSMT